MLNKIFTQEFQKNFKIELSELITNFELKLELEYSNYKHFSFDLWLTLIKSNPEFKKKRNLLFKDFLLNKILNFIITSFYINHSKFFKLYYFLFI